ncbi:MAG: alpha/beta fold hydrolase [Akkermansiaceae bacterium]
MKTSALQFILPSLAADALCLGPHWIYNPAKIKRLYPEMIQRYADPQTQYHAGKVAGDFTHYGDQTVVLLRSIVLRQGFDPTGWRDDWLRFWKTDPPAYFDGASKDTMEFLERGVDAASESNDLAGASRIAPVIAALANDPLEKRIVAARTQTALTHGDKATIDTAEFFTRAVDEIVNGKSIQEALKSASAASYQALDAQADIATAITLLDLEPNAAGEKMGLTCHTPEAFPLTLYFLLKFSAAPLDALVQNAMAGGDNSARGMLIGLVMGVAHGTSWMPSAWTDELSAFSEISALLALLEPSSAPSSQEVTIPHPDGHHLIGLIDIPVGPPVAFATFAHCFTCGKSMRGAARISRLLARQGIATLRFDFTGIGNSEGNFTDTSFLTNVDDVRVAADWLRENYRAPTLLIGHSLGGAAVLTAAPLVPECRGIVTIGAPSDPGHVLHLFEESLEDIRRDGSASVSLAGRKFSIGSKFLDDLEDLSQHETIAALKCSLLIMHSPEDETVPIQNAGHIYSAAKHPKSFHALAGADHLLTRSEDADYAAGIIAAWAHGLI